MAKYIFRTDPKMAGSNYRAGELPAGPYIAEVMAIGDPTKNNRVAVSIIDQDNSVSKDDPATWIDVTIALPHYGAVPHTTGRSSRSKDEHDGGTSYGLTISEPDVGTNCLVTFANGDRSQGYIIAFIPNPFQSATTTGRGIAVDKELIAWTDYDKEEWFNSGKQFPIIEKNLKAADKPNYSTITKLKYGFDRLMSRILYAQGLLFDTIRGVTSTSTARQAPKGMIGMSTQGRKLPDPADDSELLEKYQSNPYGLSTSELDITSRKPGHSFIMDDGEVSGSNDLIRLRSGTGHQILLHDTKGLLYIANASGTSWIEMSKSGKIDIFAGDSMSIHTHGDLNLTADRNFNLTVGEDVNISASGKVKSQSGKGTHLTAGESIRTNAGTSTTINSGTFMANYAETNQTMIAQGTTNVVSKGILSLHGTANIGIESFGGNVLVKGTEIRFNDSSEDHWPDKHSADIPLEATTSSITARIPQHEPWDQHEDLDPIAFTKAETAAGSEQQSVFIDGSGTVQYSKGNKTGPQ